MTVTCPQCGKPAEYSPQNPHRPFCSERCQLIDLGQWADEKYTIPSRPASPEELPHTPQQAENAENGDDPVRH